LLVLALEAWLHFQCCSGDLRNMSRQGFSDNSMLRSYQCIIRTYIGESTSRHTFSLLDDISIDLYVFLSHHASREIALYMHACHITINLINAWNKTYHFCDIMYQEACFTMDNNFRCGPTCNRNDRTPESHSLNHHHTKRLLPLNWVEETTCTV